MKRTKAAVVATALLAGCISLSVATSASADVTPQTKDVIGAGSDTSQYALNYIADGYKNAAGQTKAGYNASASARLISFDAITINNVVHDQIVLRPGKASVVRPNGSGEGKATLYSTPASDFNYARSSSALNAAEIAAGLQAVPFAVDGLKLAVPKSGTNAPATISATDMVKIYDGTYTNWSQLGGANAPIVAYIPQTGSGTRSFFEAQLKTANGNVTVQLASTIKVSQEHDESIFDSASATYGANAINAVAPFSTGRGSIAPASTYVSFEAGFSAQRALYNVVRGTDVTKSWFTALFSPTGFVCGSNAKGAITAAGFSQLATPDNGGVCGAPTQAATSNFTLS